MRWLCAAGLLLLLVMSAAPVSAMKFHLVKTTGGQAVLAAGDIVRGDAKRLSRALGKATRNKQGTMTLLLDSSGGLVGEALMMATVMDRVGVTTIVRKGSVCASACASVLFISGRYRTVETGGALIIHSCFDARNGRAMDDCNAVISAHAEQEGVSGLAMMALQTAAGTEGAFLFDTKGAACFGLTRQPGVKVPKTPPCLAAAQKKASAKK